VKPNWFLPGGAVSSACWNHGNTFPDLEIYTRLG